MIRLALVAAAAALALGAAPAGAADECDGLMVCIPVAGPWVVIPAGGATASWRLSCPEGVVGGVDARVIDPAVAVDFPGLIGSPVNPGITTRDSLVFRATYTGRTRRAAAFRPFIGCIPGGGGGPRVPTGRSPQAVVKPGEPVTLRVRTLRVKAGALARATHSCRPGERLLRASHAVGLRTGNAPSAAQLAAVRVVRVVSGGRILVSATRRGLAPRIRVDVQVHAECAR